MNKQIKASGRQIKNWHEGQSTKHKSMNKINEFNAKKNVIVIVMQ